MSRFQLFRKSIGLLFPAPFTNPLSRDRFCDHPVHKGLGGRATSAYGGEPVREVDERPRHRERTIQQRRWGHQDLSRDALDTALVRRLRSRLASCACVGCA